MEVVTYYPANEDILLVTMKTIIIAFFVLSLVHSYCCGGEDRYRNEFSTLINNLGLKIEYSKGVPISVFDSDRSLLDSLSSSEYIKDAIIGRDGNSVLFLVEDSDKWYTCLYLISRLQEDQGWTVHSRLMARGEGAVLPMNTWIKSIVIFDGGDAVLEVARKLRDPDDSKIHNVYYDYEIWNVISGVKKETTIRWSRY